MNNRLRHISLKHGTAAVYTSISHDALGAFALHFMIDVYHQPFKIERFIHAQPTVPSITTQLGSF